MAQKWFSGAGAPTSTPTETGNLYTDLTNDRTYISTDTSSSADWDIIPANISEISIDADINLQGTLKLINALGLDFQASTELTIATGAVTQTQTLHTIDTQGDAADDDLDTITIATDCNMLCLKLEDNSRVVTLKHGTGNLTLPSSSDVIMVANVLYILVYDGSAWNLVSDPSASGSTLPVTDATAIVKGSIDDTKKVRLEVDTNVTASTTRVLTIADKDMDLSDSVEGPASATDNAIARFDATTGKLIQDSGVLLDDSENLTGVAKIETSDHLELTEIAAPSTPSTGKVALYTKTDGKAYIKDDTGTETDLTASGGDTLPVIDTTGIAKGSVDDTKIVRFEVDGITTGTTRVLTMPDNDVNLGTDFQEDLSGATLTAAVVATGDKITGQDVDDSDNLKTFTAQSIADLKVSELSEDTSPVAGGDISMGTHQMQWAKGADVASATALTLGTDGNSYDVTGTTTITSINTVAIGTVVALHFDGILTFTHHATDLILPGAANITTAAGDIALMYEYASGDWRCISYQVAADAPGGGGGGGQTLGTVAMGALEVDWSAGNTFTKSISTNSTFTFSGESNGYEVLLIVTSTSAAELTLPASVTVLSGTFEPDAVNYITVWCNNSTTEQLAIITQEGATGGTIAQVVYTEDSTYRSTTTAIPNDNTIPQNTEGADCNLDTAITPTDSGSNLLIIINVFVAAGGYPGGAIALFKDSDADAIAANQCYLNGAEVMTLVKQVSATDTSSRTYKVRYGSNAGTAYMNGNGAAKFSTAVVSSITIMEILP
jgi:hypothetical protein